MPSHLLSNAVSQIVEDSPNNHTTDDPTRLDADSWRQPLTVLTVGVGVIVIPILIYFVIRLISGLSPSPKSHIEYSDLVTPVRDFISRNFLALTLLYASFVALIAKQMTREYSHN